MQSRLECYWYMHLQVAHQVEVRLFGGCSCTESKLYRISNSQNTDGDRVGIVDFFGGYSQRGRSISEYHALDKLSA